MIDAEQVDRLQTDRMCVHVATVSTNGMREFVFYCGNRIGVEVALAQLRNEVTSHEIQAVMQPDPKWRVFKLFRQ